MLQNALRQDDMKVLGLKLDRVTIYNVIGAFLKIGCVDEACRAFEEIKEKEMGVGQL